MVSVVLILSVVVFWLAIIICSKKRDPPSIRYMHLMKVTFTAPAIGVTLSAVPAILVAIAAYQYQQSTLFADLPADWTMLGEELSNKVII